MSIPAFHGQLLRRTFVRGFLAIAKLYLTMPLGVIEYYNDRIVSILLFFNMFVS